MTLTKTVNKIKRIFDNGCIVDKKLASLSDNFRKIPRFVADYLVSTFVDSEDPSPGLRKIDKLMKEHYVDSEQKELIKSRIREKGSHHLIGNIRCRYDQKIDMYWASVGALNDNNIRISPHVLAEYGDILLTTVAWATIQITFDPTKFKGKLYPFVIMDFTPFQITSINVDEWISKREEFSDQEWLDLLISSVGFNPAKFTHREKMLYLMRLVPFIESNVNMVELGPPETGKTFNYRQLSSYGYVVSGSKTTVASLFYNKIKKQMGVLGYRDCVMFDEINDANFNGQEELVSILKDFMNTGRFGRDTTDFSSDCSIVFAGNINCDREEKSIHGFYRHLFMPFPELIQNDRAFLDRINGFIPGWEIQQIKESYLSKELGFMADYFSEIMHKMRDRNYGHVILDQVEFGDMGQRNQQSILKVGSGLIKLMYPHRTDFIEKDELKLVLDIAIELRQRVVDQLAKISPKEFENVKLGYTFKD